MGQPTYEVCHDPAGQICHYLFPFSRDGVEEASERGRLGAQPQAHRSRLPAREIDPTLRAEVTTEAGNVGVWTKADSVTLFDDFSYGSAK